ncbi:MAG: hypothetical protein J6B71_02360 [Clostridia bacterium]|nr:hypothetical protein [Clostridia bacterium]
MDQNNQWIPEENNGTAKNEFQFETGDKTPKKKRGFWLGLILGGIGGLVVVALAVAAILFVPVLFGDPVENTVDAIFFDVDAVETLLTDFEKSGVNVKASGRVPQSVMQGLRTDLTVKMDGSAIGADEREVGTFTVTLGAGEQELACTVYYDNEIIAVKGLCEDKEQYVSLPRKGVSAALKESPLHPNSDTLLAMDEDAYDELVAYLESLDTEVTESDEEMEKSIDNFVKEIEKQAKTTTTFGFRKDGFGLYKKVKIELDGEALDKIVKCAIDEAEDNERLDHIITFHGEVDEATGEAEKLTLSDWLKEHDDRLDSTSLLVVYTVAGGKLDTINIQASWENDLEKTDSFALEISFVYDEDDLGFDAKLIEKTAGKAFTSVETSNMEYRKEIEKDKIGLRGRINYENRLEEKNTVTKEGTSELYLVYDKDECEYHLEITDSESEETTEIRGAFELNARKQQFEFSIASIKSGDTNIDNAIFSISAEKTDKKPNISKPEHQPLLKMKVEDLKKFFWKLPIDGLDAVAEEWIGAPISSYLGIIVTSDDKILLQKEKAMKEVQESYDAYVKYLKYTSSGTRVVKTYVYIEEYEFYVLMSYNITNNTIQIDAAYELTDQQKRTYREANVENGTMTIKK